MGTNNYTIIHTQPQQQQQQQHKMKRMMATMIFDFVLLLCIIITTSMVQSFTLLPTTTTTTNQCKTTIRQNQYQSKQELFTFTRANHFKFNDNKNQVRLLLSSTSPSSSSSSTTPQSSSSSSSSVPSSFSSYEILNADIATDEWELDCYSRPVLLENGKKLWEVLITDSNGSFRYVQEIPSSQVNSKQLRTIIDNVIEMVDKKPNTIRFFRGAMFNMISIALSELPVSSKPSRCTFALNSWLEERQTSVYPKMKGYSKNMIQQSNAPSFLNVRTPVKLPDSLRGEKYAFVALPLAEFLPDGSVNESNIGVGRLCPIPKTNNNSLLLPGDVFIQGVVILSNRASALASWLAGTEMVSIQADLRKRIVTMETDIDTQYLMAKLNDQQRLEAAAFEEGKAAAYGLHFVSVQETDDTDPAGFWLLREPPTGI